jgi:uncharacterized protein YifE (UPF0438 family)/triacylglycerol esterase/lipase EstA (alpha/beta hydrolase family)
MRIFVFFFIIFNLTGCTYVRIYNEQLSLTEKQATNPSQSNLKHLLDSVNVLTYGTLIDLRSIDDNAPLCVFALSNRYTKNEIVDHSCDNSPNHNFKLNLPYGAYTLAVIDDTNEDMHYQGSEIIASRTLKITAENAINDVISDINIYITKNKPASIHGLNYLYKDDGKSLESLFYPRGFIRSLADPIFSRTYAFQGFYSSSKFIEHVPKMFYALDEFHEFKIPVIFVHGVNGTPRDFIPILNTLDDSRFAAYFFYYPSGSQLDQIATFFHNMALSGNEYRSRNNLPIIIVAHSMGGVVVREALNLNLEHKLKNKVALFISIAAPFGGHPDASLAVHNAPLLIPSWRDLSSESRFIKNLQRYSFPSELEHHLFFAYKNLKTLKFGANSDGNVPLSSQLDPTAMKNATRIYAYNKTHTSILRDNDAIEQIQKLLLNVKLPYPEAHHAYLNKGGFHRDLDAAFTPKEQYAIETYGFYLRALDNGKIKPVLKEQQNFMRVMKSRKKNQPMNYMESAWLKFRKHYPDIASGKVEH